jgi:hypothetical protein
MHIRIEKWKVLSREECWTLSQAAQAQGPVSGSISIGRLVSGSTHVGPCLRQHTCWALSLAAHMLGPVSGSTLVGPCLWQHTCFALSLEAHVLGPVSGSTCAGFLLSPAAQVHGYVSGGASTGPICIVGYFKGSFSGTKATNRTPLPPPPQRLHILQNEMA